MYLLDTTTGQLEMVDDPRKERYAILSHVWQHEGEQTYEHIQALNRGLVRRLSSALRVRRNDPVSILPRASAKIRECCEYARKRGFKKIWIDTCCIDKSSSSELSEAVRRQRPGEPEENELLVSAEQVVQARVDLTGAYRSQVPGVHLEGMAVHRHEVHEQSLDTVSVARRMSWASTRETKRPEDEAYSLMGIFGVRMPTIYGEGRAAFLRLQEEILKHIRDQSIFAWGSIFGVSSRGSSLRWQYEYKEGFDPSILFARSPAEFYHSGDIEPIPLDELERRLGIHARVPDYTITSYGVRSSFPSIVINNSSTSSLRLAILGCHVAGNNTASRGKLIALLLTQQPGTSEQSQRFIVGARGPQIPQWLFEDLDGNSYTPSETIIEGTRTVSSRSYSTRRGSSSGSSFSPTPTDKDLFRAVVLPRSQYEEPVRFYSPSSTYESGGLMVAAWARLCITHRSLFDASSTNMWDVYTWGGLVRTGSDVSAVPMSYECPCEVIILGWTITRLEAKGYSFWLLPQHRCNALALPIGFPSSPKIHSLALCSTSEVILIHVGACPAFVPPPPHSSSRVALLQNGHYASSTWRASTPGHAPEVYPALCVTVVFMPGPKVAIPEMDRDDDDDPHLETCWMDHVDSWEGGVKMFKRGKTTVQIAFTACPGAWTHQPQQQHGTTRRVPGRPMYIMSVKVNPKTGKPGVTPSVTTGTSLH